ncbi:hypothetical protein [Peribacillus asahii]|uniref:Uncharacterized protein n=1 Tax=Peribacillus asahii TaxID=228899 RepID=A0A3T0KVH5_9BACI|nr:hypothetical protein [Peribacillus asahii]AZV44340.1 hypothetical protein BAOM_3731 [Peribacillus asahii]USK84043.1 hypothetical protein LIT35_16590 [Peribacillus asahii]
MLDLDKTREKILALDESGAKTLLMITASYVEMVHGGNGGFTNDKCVDALIKMFNSIPEPDVLKEMYKK